MGEQLFRTGGLILIWVIFLLARRRARMAPVLVIAACGALVYFAVNVGFVLEPGQVIGITLLALFTFRPGVLRELTTKYAAPFLIFYIYAFAITILNMPLWPEDGGVAQGFFYSKWMCGPVQMFQVLIGLCIMVFIIRSVRSIQDIALILRVTMIAMAAICLYGLYVWFAQQYGLPFNSITRQGGAGGHEPGRVISTMVGGERVARAYSLTGEPKSLASNAILLIALALFTARHGIQNLRQIMPSVAAITLGLVTLFLTYSTAGFIIITLAFMAATAMATKLPPLRTNLAFQLPILATLGVAAYIWYGDEILPLISEALATRLDDRLDDQGLFTYADAGMIWYFSTNPFHALFGVGMGGSTFYVRLFDSFSYEGFIAAPRGIVGFISDFGVAGLLIFAYAIANCLVPIVRRARLPDRNAALYSNVAIFVIVALVLKFTFSTWYLEWLTLGMLIAAARLAHSELIKYRQAAAETSAIVDNVNFPTWPSGNMRSRHA